MHTRHGQERKVYIARRSRHHVEHSVDGHRDGLWCIRYTLEDRQQPLLGVFRIRDRRPSLDVPRRILLPGRARDVGLEHVRFNHRVALCDRFVGEGHHHRELDSELHSGGAQPHDTLRDDPPDVQNSADPPRPQAVPVLRPAHGPGERHHRLDAARHLDHANAVRADVCRRHIHDRHDRDEGGPLPRARPQRYRDILGGRDQVAEHLLPVPHVGQLVLHHVGGDPHDASYDDLFRHLHLCRGLHNALVAHRRHRRTHGRGEPAVQRRRGDQKGRDDRAAHRFASKASPRP
mmetsp:Transcript_77210/g.214697  ORF Transcript_77210/g.214697 Transcript_77210/m.214697 type:complete len:290 (-) Transcript_77210:371-1240(-)